MTPLEIAYNIAGFILVAVLFVCGNKLMDSFSESINGKKEPAKK